MRRWFLTAVVLTCVAATAQQTVTLTLDRAIERARVSSVSAEAALNALKASYWEYRSYRASLLPEFNFEATAPSYAKSYSAYQLDDGSYTFVRNNRLDFAGTLTVDQGIWLTGGSVSLKSSLELYRQLDGNYSNRFMSVPFALTLTQPVFGVNHLKWSRRIEPVRYLEAQAGFLEATEQVAMNTITSFFNLLSAMESVNIARQNLENAARLLEVAKAKREMGQISKNDLLSLELNRLQAESDLTDAGSQMRSSMFKLSTFLGYPEDTEIVPVMPGEVPAVDVTYGDVLEKALDNNAFSKNIRRRQLEADYEVAKAKGNLREISLFAQVGYTGTSNRFKEAYDRLKDNQIVEVGMKIPLIDWGRRRGKVRVAENNRRLTQSRLRQESLEFNQDLFILVERFNNQRQQVAIAMTADTIAERRYQTNVETFMRGRISTLDLNDSRVTKDQTRLEYISELYRYWFYFYQIRSLTLFDYVAGHRLEFDLNELVKR